MKGQTVAENILNRMRGSKGSVWTAKDLMDLGTRAAVDQALRRLALGGRIRKVARGLYDYPQSSPLVGTRAPRVHAVARAAARARGAQVRPTGAAAANALGLSSQVPARADFITDGPAKHIQIGKQHVRLKKVPRSRLALPAGAGALVEALRYLGRDAVANLSDGDIRRVSNALSDADCRALRNAMHYAPDWMAPTINDIRRAARLAKESAQET
jgi:hypothetical protein